LGEVLVVGSFGAVVVELATFQDGTDVDHPVMGCLHDPANVQQMCSKYTC